MNNAITGLGRSVSLLCAVTMVGCGGGSGGGSNGGSPSQAIYAISGTISGAVADGVLVTFSGTETRTTVTSGGGHYTLSAVSNGSYTVTPTASGYTFSPPSAFVSVSGTNVTGLNFFATSTSGAQAILGTVSGAVSDGVSITLSGTETRTSTTSGGGHYSFIALRDGMYKVTPSLSGYRFSPASYDVAIAGNTVGRLDFSATASSAITGTISGAVADGVLVTFSGTETRTTVTSGGGHYSFSVSSAQTYTVTPSLPGFTFSPRSVSRTGSASISDNFVATAVSSSNLACSLGHWCSYAPSADGAAGNLLAGIWGTSSADVWAVGEAGTILHWDGAAWAAVASGTSSDLRGVWGTSATDAWAVGTAGTILHWNGTVWTEVASGAYWDLRGVWGTSTSDVWAVGDKGTVVHWDGIAWSPRANGSTDTALYRDVWASNTSDVWAVGFAYYYHWNGSSWARRLSPAGNGFGVWGASDSDVWAVGEHRSISHWNGNAWSQVTYTANTSESFTHVHGINSTDVWVVGSQGTMLHWDGYTWNTVASGTGNALLGVWTGGPTDAWAVGASGTLLRFRP